MFTRSLKIVLKNYPCPFVTSPLKSDGMPSIDMVKWLVVWAARLKDEKDKLEREVIAKDRLIGLYKLRERKKAESLQERHNLYKSKSWS